MFAFIILAATPFSTLFWITYWSGGLSDILDGFIARRMNQQSKAGAKLDSIADLVFILVIVYVVINNLTIPILLWGMGVLILCIRMVSYGIGYYKFHGLSALHTYLNKATGLLLFLSPLLYLFLSTDLTGILIGLVAFIAAVEELLIIIRSRKLNRDCKSIFLFDRF